MKNALDIFEWAQQSGDANITDRILVKILPELLRQKKLISSQMIQNKEEIIVDEVLYDMIKEAAQKLIDSDVMAGSCHV